MVRKWWKDRRTIMNLEKKMKSTTIGKSWVLTVANSVSNALSNIHSVFLMMLGNFKGMLSWFTEKIMVLETEDLGLKDISTYTVR